MLYRTHCRQCNATTYRHAKSKYCSNACKQQAYRQRKYNSKPRPTRPDTLPEIELSLPKAWNEIDRIIWHAHKSQEAYLSARPHVQLLKTIARHLAQAIQQLDDPSLE